MSLPGQKTPLTPEQLVERHRAELESHAASDRASSWLATALLDYVDNERSEP